MTSSLRAAVLAAACMLGLLAPASARSQDSGNLTGRWVLNRNQSQVDKEVGFNPDWLTAGVRSAQGDSGGGGGRGRRGSGGGEQGGFAAPRESEEDARRVQELSSEARVPSPHLTILDARGTVTITDADDASRTLHTDGNDDSLQVRGLRITAVTVRESGHVVVRYKVQQGRELRYTYTRESAGPKLTVDIQFLERGGVADSVRRVYDLIGPDDPFPTTPDVRAASEILERTQDYPRCPPTAGLRGAAPAAASGAAPPAPLNQQPDAELKGLTRLGIVIEALGAQAASCGLTEAALETAVAGRLKSAGFTVLTNTDEDSYVYVNVITGSVSTGSCVSRFDVTVSTHTTARLTYQPSPVLVQVSLLHKGGIIGGPTAGHAATVVKGVTEYLDAFITRIKAANM